MFRQLKLRCASGFCFSTCPFLSWSIPLGSIFRKHGISYFSYANDMQFHLPVTRKNKCAFLIPYQRVLMMSNHGFTNCSLFEQIIWKLLSLAAQTPGQVIYLTLSISVPYISAGLLPPSLLQHHPNLSATSSSKWAARFLKRCKKLDHVTPLLRSLHWLPDSQ